MAGQVWARHGKVTCVRMVGAGKGVHVVTVNDYLARRDSEWVGQVHRFLGLEVGLVQQGLNVSEDGAGTPARKPIIGAHTTLRTQPQRRSAVPHHPPAVHGLGMRGLHYQSPCQPSRQGRRRRCAAESWACTAVAHQPSGLNWH